MVAVGIGMFLHHEGRDACSHGIEHDLVEIRLEREFLGRPVEIAGIDGLDRRFLFGQGHFCRGLCGFLGRGRCRGRGCVPTEESCLNHHAGCDYYHDQYNGQYRSLVHRKLLIVSHGNPQDMKNQPAMEPLFLKSPKTMSSFSLNERVLS